jgi:S-adenosylmethionine:tRNA ribosyltransferase-isomerase
LRVDLFDFDLPAENIALRPASPRDAARMLVVRPDGLVDSGVRDLAQWLRAGDVLVFNDTRVIPAQLEGIRLSQSGEARIGATLHKRLDLRRWQAFVRNGKRLKEGDVIHFPADVKATSEERFEDGSWTLAFHGDELHARTDLFAGRGWNRTRISNAACRRGHVPAGEGG